MALFPAPVIMVALRKESVDRNFNVCNPASTLPSLSARRAWIEITTYLETSSIEDVALRKESVDRNKVAALRETVPSGRSPQGERG